MHNFQSFSVTFPEVRQYRLAVWLETYAAITTAITACLSFGFIGGLNTLLGMLWMSVLAAIIMVTSTRYGMKLKRELSPVLNEKLRHELRSRSGLVIPAGFPAVDQFRMLPLITSDGSVVIVSIKRRGDIFVVRRELSERIRSDAAA